MEEHPLLLLIDDYPRSDEASLAVLHMLLRRTALDRMMVVLTGRPAEPDEPAQSKRIRQGLAYLPMQQIELGPLPEAESHDMLSAILAGSGKEPSGPIRRAIVLGAAGNPMALDLLAQDWLAHGDMALAVSLPAMRSEMPESAVEAAKYDQLIARMLPLLPPRARTALYFTAILGPRLNDFDLFEIVDLSSGQTLQALSELSSRRVLRDPGGGLEFSNELMRARLYLRIPKVVRRRLHDGVATNLLKRTERGESVPGLEIAWHCIRANRQDEATPYLQAGARYAIVGGAPDEAARALSTAIGHLKGRDKDESLLLLAEAYQEMGEWRAALESLHEMSDQRDPDHEHMAFVRRALSDIGMETLSSSELLRVGEALLETADKSVSTRTQVEALLAASYVGSRLASPALQHGVLRRIDDLNPLTLDPRSAARRLLARGSVQHDTREGDRGLTEATEGVRVLCEARATDTTFVRLQTGIGATAMSLGRYEDAIEPLQAAALAASKLDNQTLLVRAVSNLLLCRYRIGITPKQLQFLETAATALRHLPAGARERIDVTINRCRAMISLGRSSEARTLLSSLADAKANVNQDWMRQYVMLQEAEIYWLLGSKKKGIALARSILREWDRPKSFAVTGQFVRWLSIVSVHDGSVDGLPTILKGYVDELEHYDMLDQAEILCSWEFARRSALPAMEDRTAQMKEVLSRLPVSCGAHFQRVGTLLPV